MGGGQNLERPNVERPIFRKFETSNIEITKSSYSIFLFSIQFLIFIVQTLKIYDNLSNWKFLEYLNFYKWSNFENFLIFEIVQFQKLDIFGIFKFLQIVKF